LVAYILGQHSAGCCRVRVINL